MFDLRTMTTLWETNVKNGVCSIEFDRKDIKMNKMVVSGLEATFNVYDMRTQHPKYGFAHVTEKVCECCPPPPLRPGQPSLSYIFSSPPLHSCQMTQQCGW